MPAGIIMPLTQASQLAPLVIAGGLQTPLVRALGLNFDQNGFPTGVRDIELLNSPAFTVASVPDLGDAEDLGTSTQETLTWEPFTTPQTPQSQCIHFFKYDISSTQLSQSINPTTIFPAEQMVSGNRFVDTSRATLMDPYSYDKRKGLAIIAQKMEWVMLNSVMQIPSTDTEKWRGQGIVNGCLNVIDAALTELTSDMLMELSLLVPPMADPVLFVTSAFFPQLKNYTIPAANVGIFSQPMTYISLTTQPVKVVIDPFLQENTIVLMDLAKCRMSFIQTRYTDDMGNQQFNDIIFDTRETSKKTGAVEGRIGAYMALNPGSFSYHAVLKNVLPQGTLP